MKTMSIMTIILVSLLSATARAETSDSTPASTPASLAPSAPGSRAEPTSGSPRPISRRRTSKYGGCLGDFCLAPAVALSVFEYAPTTGNMTGGIALSGGYGIVWHGLVDLGLAIYGGAEWSRDRPAEAHGLLMLNIANYLALGGGFLMQGKPSGPAGFTGIVCLAANWIPGLGISSE